MENQDEFAYTIGELAQQVGVTVRTLQYYDRVKLLKAQITEGGRRVYTRDSLFRLQQILFFKSMGFSLEEIGGKLLRGRSSSDLESVFTGQREAIREQIKNLKQIVVTLDAILAELRVGKEASIDHLMTVLELMRQKNPYAFMIRYFGDDQLKHVSERFPSQVDYERYMNRAKEVFGQLVSLYRKGVDPEGKEGQKLAEDWWDMVSEFTGGDSSLLAPMIAGGKDIDNWPEESEGFKEAIGAFLVPAFKLYFKTKGIELPEMEG